MNPYFVVTYKAGESDTWKEQRFDSAGQAEQFVSELPGNVQATISQRP